MFTIYGILVVDLFRKTNCKIFVILQKREKRSLFIILKQEKKRKSSSNEQDRTLSINFINALFNTMKWDACALSDIQESKNLTEGIKLRHTYTQVKMTCGMFQIITVKQKCIRI